MFSREEGYTVGIGVNPLSWKTSLEWISDPGECQLRYLQSLSVVVSASTEYWIHFFESQNTLFTSSNAFHMAVYQDTKWWIFATCLRTASKSLKIPRWCKLLEVSKWNKEPKKVKNERLLIFSFLWNFYFFSVELFVTRVI